MDTLCEGVQEKFALLIQMGWDTNVFCIYYGMQEEMGKGKNVSLLTIIGNWGNQVRGIVVLKLFEGEKAIALHEEFLTEKVDRLFLEVNDGKRL